MEFHRRGRLAQNSRNFPQGGAGNKLHSSRRDFLKSSLAAIALSAIPEDTIPPSTHLLKGGRVLSLDRSVGDFEKADVLIEGSRIAMVQPNIRATAAKIIDASNTIVMPGFIDTHRHAWQAPLRNILPDGLLSDYTRD